MQNVRRVRAAALNASLPADEIRGAARKVLLRLSPRPA